MGIIDNLFIKINRNISVIHSLPGRLRVHIPLTRKIPEEYSAFISLMKAILSIPDEINSIEISSLSGSVLILYDKDRSSEKKIMTFIDSVMDILVRIKDSLGDKLSAEDLKAERIETVKEKLIAELKKGLTPGPILDRTMEINTDVLA